MCTPPAWTLRKPTKKKRSYVSNKDFWIDGKKDNKDLLAPDENNYYDEFFKICQELDLTKSLVEQFKRDNSFIKYVTQKIFEEYDVMS